MGLIKKLSDNTPKPTVVIQFSWQSLLTIGLIFLGIWVTWLIRDFLVLLFASTVVAAACAPIVRSLENRHLPRWLAIVVIYAAVIALVLTMVVLIIPQVISQISHFSQQAQTISSGTTGPLRYLKFFQDPSSILQAPETLGGVVGITATFVNGLVSMIAFFVLTFYMILEGRRLVRFLLAFIPDETRRHEVAEVMVNISNRMGYWFRGQFVVSITTFIVVYLGLSLLHVPYALSLAVICGIAEFVPLLGSWIGGVVATLVALGQGGLPLAAVTGGFIAIWQIIQGHILVPQIMRQVLGIPSILVFISVLILAHLIGFVGVFLATPIAAAVSVLTQTYFETMKNRVQQHLATNARSRKRA